ncbi:methyltransferase [Paenibacillus sp. J31TS4]|uniref:class I SAM-dependent methyltransferase n=1 Tax=Paenibacillus sp. J31TS4 TaxID=2807195 RepID=UPI001AFE8D12|nr:class I SAM-dependent methyltransferase [Paenibacillus sp. J31TS4]GIP37126.1 methyltransferase [Paenibacillus sp. J31TS4]
MAEYEWDGRIEYLRRTRDTMYNDDYLAFLVEKVWRIERPVRMIDYGCGYGYLGWKLLPLLPEGSTYTGVDKGPKLLSAARELFAGTSYDVQWIEGDLETLAMERRYDLAVSHTFLMHMKQPKEVLLRMIDSVSSGGLVACFEANWIANSANFYADGIEQSELIPLGFLQRLFEGDTRRDGKDGNIGIKLPVYFRQLGLKDVQCRMSDKVNLLDPNGEAGERERLLAGLRPGVPGDRGAFVQGLLARGATAEEAERQYDSEVRYAQAFDGLTFLVNAPSMKITFGTVERDG